MAKVNLNSLNEDEVGGFEKFSKTKKKKINRLDEDSSFATNRRKFN